MARSKNTRYLLSLLLPAIFCWHMASITLFPHFHEVNGVVICHSHPFAGTADNPGHTHTAIQFDTIAHLSLLILVLTAVLGVLALLRAWTATLSVSLERNPAVVPVGADRLRGPPCR